MSTVGFSQDNSMPLMADVQYMEPYASSALNRKFKNILLAGFYSGFIPLPGSGLNLLVTSAVSAGGLGAGAASIDTNSFQISVQQNADVTIALAAGKSYIIALQADYEFGTITNQVDANSSVKATQIIALDINAKLQSNQIELCRVVIPSGTKQITKPMISTLYRIDRLIGITLSDRIDLADSNTGASSQAVKSAHESAKKYADDNKAALGTNNDITELNAITSLGKNKLAIGGYVTINNGLSVTSETHLSSGAYVDPLNGTSLGLKVSGGMAVGGDVTFNDALSVKGKVVATGGVRVTGNINTDSLIISGSVTGAMPSRVLPTNWSATAWYKIATLNNAQSNAVWLTLLLSNGNYCSRQMGQDIISLSGRNMPSTGTAFTADIAQGVGTHLQLMTAESAAAQIGLVANIVEGVYKSVDVFIKAPAWWNGATISVTGGVGYTYYGNSLTTISSEPEGIQYLTPSFALSSNSSNYDLSQGDMTLNSLSLKKALSLENGGTGATDAKGARKALELGTAALNNIGTSGTTVPLLNTSNTWSEKQTFVKGIGSQDEIISSSNNALRMVAGSKGAILRQDGSSFFFLISTSASGLGNWNDLRPLSINMTNGFLTSINGQAFSGNTKINDTLTLANALSLANGGTGAKTLEEARSNLQVSRLTQGDEETQLFNKEGTHYLYINSSSFGLYKAGVGYVPLGLGQGGTGATNAEDARKNLKLGSAALMSSSSASYDKLEGLTTEAASTAQLVGLRDDAALKAKTNTFTVVQYMKAGVALSGAPGGDEEKNGLFNGPGDGASATQYNTEIRSWQGLGFRDTCYNKTNIFFNLRTGEINTSGGVRTQGLTVNGGSMTIIGSGNSNAQIGSGASDVYIQNTVSKKFLQLKDDGTLQYDNKKIYHEGNKPSFAELLNSSNDGNIPSLNNGDDLNDYKTAGKFRCPSVTYVLGNAPVGSVRFNMTVENVQTGIEDNGTMQTLIVGSDSSRPQVFVRCFSNKTWSLWVDMASNVFPHGITVHEGVNVADGDFRVGNGYIKSNDASHYLFLGANGNDYASLGSWGGYFEIKNTGNSTIPTKFENGKITTLGDIVINSDNSMLLMGKNSDFGIVKKSGAGTKIVVGSGISFTVATANTTTVSPSSSQVDLFSVDNDGTGNFKSNLVVNGSTLTITGTDTSNLVVGSGSSDVYLRNTKADKHLQLGDDGYLRYSGQKVYHEGNKPTTAELGFSIGNKDLNWDSTNRTWVRIAVVDVRSAGSAYITITGGAGYDAGSAQQASTTDLVIRGGNGTPTNSITLVGYVRGNGVADSIHWKYSGADTNYEIWANVKKYTQGLVVEGRSTSGTVISYSDSATGTQPDGLTSGKLYYMQYGENTSDRFVNATGDTMAGALNFANNTWNKFGDDVQIGNKSQAGRLCIQGLNGITGISLCAKGSTDSTTSTYIVSDGANLGLYSLSNTNIHSYLNVYSGATVQGNIYIQWGGRGHVYQENGDIVLNTGSNSIFSGYSATSLGGALGNVNNNAVNGVNRANDAWNKANDAQVNRVQDIRLTGQESLYVGKNTGTVRAPGGAVIVGAIVNGEWDNNEYLLYAYVQKYVNGNWYTIGQA